MAIEIQTKKNLIKPIVLAGVTWETQRVGTPGKLCFSALCDSKLDVQEGSIVTLKENGKKIFFGYIFYVEDDGDGTLSFTAYDQLRYFKNKDTYVYTGLKANEVVARLAADFMLKTGILEDTEWVIPTRAEDNVELFAIVQNALDETNMHTGKMFVLYDDCGKLTLKNAESMKINILIDKKSAQGYNFKSSIDEETYNKVKLMYGDGEKKARQYFIAKDDEKCDEWGILQYFEKIDDIIGAQEAANLKLESSSAKKRTFSISGAFGDARVRAGCALPVFFNLQGEKLRDYMMAEKVKHAWNDGIHTMDLTLVGRGISA